MRRKRENSEKNHLTHPQADASLEDLFEHFRNVNNSPDTDESADVINENDIQNEDNQEINRPISHDEINKCINKLKNNKASGIDMVVNEHIN